MLMSHEREPEWTRFGVKVAQVSCKDPVKYQIQAIKEGKSQILFWTKDFGSLVIFWKCHYEFQNGIDESDNVSFN